MFNFAPAMTEEIVYSEKQLAIISAAERLFSITGFDGTSVRDIAQEAGVNVAMISYYFGSKEKLMEAVFENKTNKMRLKVENMLQDNSMTSLDKVNLLIDEYVEKFLSQPQFHKIMLLEQLMDKPSHASALIYNLKKRNQEIIKKLIHEGQKSGEFKKNVDVVLLMTTLVGTVSQMIISQRFYKEVNNLEELGDEDFKNYMHKKLSIHLKKLFKVILTNET